MELIGKAQIINYESTGFVFEDYSPEAMLAAIYRAVDLFCRKRPWTKLVKRVMKEDFSWKASAEKYLQLFTLVTGR